MVKNCLLVCWSSGLLVGWGGVGGGGVGHEEELTAEDAKDSTKYAKK